VAEGGRPSLDLDGRAVLVVGAGGGGIGTAVAGLVARAGAHVTGLDVRPEALDAFDAAVSGTPGTHRRVVGDARSEADVAAAVAAAAGTGPLHGLVHVAGGMGRDQWAPLVDANLTTFDAVVELNLRSALISTRTVAGHLMAEGRGGALVTIATVAAGSALPYGAAYAAAKAALLSLVRTAAVEWGGHAIRVNAVSAGTVRTPKTAGGGPMAPDSAAERTALPLGRTGRPADIASAALFLLSDLSAWITGQALVVDGGSSVRPSFLDDDDLPVFVRSPELRARLLKRPLP